MDGVVNHERRRSTLDPRLTLRQRRLQDAAHPRQVEVARRHVAHRVEKYGFDVGESVEGHVFEDEVSHVEAEIKGGVSGQWGNCFYERLRYVMQCEKKGSVEKRLKVLRNMRWLLPGMHKKTYLHLLPFLHFQLFF